VYTWLYSIAANLARNRLRDSSRKGRDQGSSLEALQEAAPALAQAAAAVHETPRTAAQRHELDAALRHCLDQLPEVYRLAFVLRIFDGLCYEDIASSAGCPAGTVKSRLNQARKLLRDCLEKQEIL
jgi:RNA polymerase sigma-70 factor (ECF subfamily)